MSSPDLTNLESDRVMEVLKTRYLSIGPRIKEFEKLIAKQCGRKFGVGVNSGTSGLHLCVIAAGISEGDLVITSPFSFVASANCILYERGIPIFVDVDPETGNIDPTLVAEAVSDLSQNCKHAGSWLPPSYQSANGFGRLKSILPVHAFGQPADMDPILVTAAEYDLVVIEDACEALGAEYKGRNAGALSDAAVFAFYPNKQISTGEGGMIVTDNEEWSILFNSLRNQGRDVFDTWLYHTRLGYNYRLDELSAALGLVQAQRLDELLDKRSQVANWYNERLAEIELIECPHIIPDTTFMSWFVYVVRVKPPAVRNELITQLADKGIPSRAYFTPIHLQPFYRETFGYGPGDFPIAEYLGSVSLALPFSSVMTENQVDYVCSVLKCLLKQSVSARVLEG
ncbi:MAG: DegT/DnrJ/EryC1/StrS family aminotransferase [Candidatus Promineifilaceae bacterium]|nr:DegT/DnrJ/EryC1/StrS family aminotransferase [Candidatus Promineifilaceae bacterium]